MNSGVEEPGVLVEFLGVVKGTEARKAHTVLFLYGNRFLSYPKIGGSKAGAGPKLYLRRLNIHPPLLVLFSNSLATVATRKGRVFIYEKNIPY